eukprot:10270290-Ditylum_brightwellii.AAC.1
MSSSDDEWGVTSHSTWGSKYDQALTIDDNGYGSNGYSTDETSNTQQSTEGSDASTSTGSDVPSLISRQHSDNSSMESDRSNNKDVSDLEADDALDEESVFLSKKNYAQSLNKDWLLLDNQSTVNLMCNP